MPASKQSRFKAFRILPQTKSSTAIPKVQPWLPDSLQRKRALVLDARQAAACMALQQRHFCLQCEQA